MKRLVALVAFAILAVGGAIARAAIPYTPIPGAPEPYVSPTGDRFAVWSSARWAHAKVLAPGTAGSLVGRPAGSEVDPNAFVWTPSCGNAAQRAVFTRTVHLYGRPRSAGVSFSTNGSG